MTNYAYTCLSLQSSDMFCVYSGRTHKRVSRDFTSKVCKQMTVLAHPIPKLGQVLHMLILAKMTLDVMMTCFKTSESRFLPAPFSNARCLEDKTLAKNNKCPSPPVFNVVNLGFPMSIYVRKLVDFNAIFEEINIVRGWGGGRAVALHCGSSCIDWGGLGGEEAGRICPNILSHCPHLL